MYFLKNNSSEASVEKLKKSVVSGILLATAAVTGTEPILHSSGVGAVKKHEKGTSMTEPGNIVPAPEWTVIAGHAESVFGQWKKHGDVITPSENGWDEKMLITVFPSTVLEVEGKIRIYYSVYDRKGFFSLAVAEIDADGTVRKYPLRHPGEGAFTFTGIPADAYPFQPNVFRLKNGSWRMYFWLHRHQPTGTAMTRFCLAQSRDGMHWIAENIERPLLVHSNGDVLALNEKRPFRMFSNDATTVYRTPCGWEVYSAANHRVAPGNKRFVSIDSAPGVVRILQRWSSPDGRRCFNPQVVLTPDSDDPPDLQFYSLSRHAFPDYTFGIIGRYECAKQQLSMEPAYTFDGIHWKRPFRRKMLSEGKQAISTLAAHTLLEKGDQLLLFYSESNFDHNTKTPDQSPPRMTIALASISRHRMFGLKTDGGKLLSPPTRLTRKMIRLWLGEKSRVKLQWYDPLDETPLNFPELNIVSDGTSAEEIPVPEELAGSLVRIGVSGQFTLFDFEY